MTFEIRNFNQGMVYYRKYRPQTIEELDNEDVRKTLISVLSSPEPPHAFLFTGPKGLGKTSSARIVAKALNCTGRKSEVRSSKSEIKNKTEKASQFELRNSNFTSIEPCNMCEMCKSITNGTNLDVLEIDAASNRGIDEIRDLRDKIRLSPVSARKKVYIIDEVHMLTSEAFNALLKTLEEPPSHAVFILATTEPQKVPATILSRCLHLSFHKATEEELLRSFKRIVVSEKLVVDEDALLEIAKLSDGGFRDGVKILEEIVQMADGAKITSSMVEKQYHSVSSQQNSAALLTLLAKKDLKGCITLVDEIAKQGSDMRFFLEQLMIALHDLLLSNVGVGPEFPRSNRGSIGVGEKTKIDLSLAEIRKLSDVLQKAHTQMRSTVVPSLPLEIAIIEYLTSGDTLDTVVVEKEKTIQVTNNEKDLDLHGMRRKVGELHKQRALTNEKEVSAKERPEGIITGPSLMAYKAQGDLTPEWLSEFWNTFIVKVKENNHTISGVLRGCRLKSFDRKHMIIETSYKFHKDRLSESKTLAALEIAAKAMAGNPVSVAIELSSAKR